MPGHILNLQLEAHKAEVSEIVKDLHQLTIDIGHDELAKTVSDLRNRINEPFMFVIVGEVKAGKSSFINALLESEKEICKVAPDPCTDTIQQIVYGEEERTIELNPHLKKILQPVEILKDIAIVDTPGTNTIVAHHQEITEEFIPASDLIVFVFEAKNPYRQSAWEFFDFIRAEWRKKVIFVLQQSDLMNEADLKVNVQGVVKHAIGKEITEPHVFAVSAKLEQEKKIEESGFTPLRDYIRDNITGGQAPALKLQNNIETAHNISGRIRDGLKVRRAQLEADREFRAEVLQSLDEQEVRSNKHVNLLVETLIAEYDRQTRTTREDIASNLGFFSLVKRSWKSIFSKDPSIKEWFKKRADSLESELNDSFDKKLRSGVVDIAESIQQMAKIIDLKLRQSPTILRESHAIFGDIADRRSAVLSDLQEAFSSFMNREENFVGSSILDEDPKFSPNIAAGSGIAVVGVVVAIVTQTTALDITGGLITALGLLFAGLTVSFKRQKILSDYQAEIDKGRKRLEGEITEKLQQYISDIKKRIDANFGEFDVMLDKEEEQLQGLEAQHGHIEGRLVATEKMVEEELEG